MAAPHPDHLRDQLIRLLAGTDAYMGFEEALAEFPLDRINEQAPNSDYTPWRLVEHLRLGQWDILEYIRNPSHISPKWPEGYWPPPGQQADQAVWRASLDAFRADLRALQDLVRDVSTELQRPLPHAPEHTVLREVLLAAAHNAFHLGEFATLRQAMQTWPSTRRP